MRRTRRAIVVALVLTLAAVPAIAVPLLAAAEQSQLAFPATADTTATPVAQDGDGTARTTLTTCPELCESNPGGWREAAVSFEVTGLPRGATGVRARLRLYSWQPFDAITTAHLGGTASVPGLVAARPHVGAGLDRVATVASGFNTWDVSAAMSGNGNYTFTVRQESRHSRIYWASRENPDATLRPQLLLTYRSSSSSGEPPPASAAAPLPPSAAAPPASAPASAAAPGAAPWKLAWEDEFDGGALDPGKWVAKDDTSVDYDLACITGDPDNVFVADGLLTLRAQRESDSCGGQTRGYTTAYLTTEGRKSFRYGRFEIRAKSPTGPAGSTGLWPAFWLRPDDGGNGEIDVVELPGGAQYAQQATQSIFYDYTPVKQDNRAALPSGQPADGFHTYATEWEPGVLRWYLDGVLVWQRDRSTTPWFDEVFGKPYHLRINFQVGGWLGAPDAATRFPADFQVDYVRAWQR